ncbi:MAG: DMT family transporter [Pseudomonadota bacterium]
MRILVSPVLLAPLFASAAVTLFALNDAAMKLLSGDYALHQLVMIRCIVALGVVFGLMVPLSGGWRVLRMQRPGLHVLRAGCVIFANLTFFLGLAALPLAEATAIFFVGPFLITIFSVVFLGETVGRRRWVAVAVGLAGVLIVLRPGTTTFQPAAVLPLAAAVGYAALSIFTRYMRATENAVSMTFSIQFVFLVVTIVLGLTIGDGKFAAQENPSLAFLFRAWVWPAAGDWPIIAALGGFASIGGYFVTQAYRLGEAALVAPFEYLALPLSIVFGIAFFGERPDAVAWAGILLIAGSGLYTAWRENQTGRVAGVRRRG